MGCHLAVGANSFARKWRVPVDRANEFAPTRSLLFIEDRAAYGERIGATVSQQLMQSYGKGFTKSALNRMANFAKFSPGSKIVHALHAQLALKTGKAELIE